mmetsp:Transcript_3766/g.11228  ORF Transcript_3766/g.11228 Transcript_3766/m.11228 type:complete len:498 (+) Transcript_3766:140-1633(+)|eukprot:CAMPEP_0198734274 /NCGR_PEP_ID=MMETSP1475-20131203/51510_1 /TAXON_ID= ORGANISM="Unidentified sp., Strain CCMP1999" /NCGR_SAMPLE_ID=MMETSP1475 /ASSEMBLY_ACC=CAM_ASM_001111 /LENGTH=497 /DNA_ID=CAMNT_0044497711 /DNA_START=81 /DNA_END=1574 /DNA_ORIENTATION=-
MAEVLSAPRFYPTPEEFADFNGYIEKIEKDVGNLGLCIVVPPAGWSPRKDRKYDDLDNLVVQRPIRQEFTGSKGVYYCVLWESRSMPLQKFRSDADKFDAKFAPVNCIRGAKEKGVTEEEAERYYWKNIRFRRPMYGADVMGSLFDEDVESWNPGKLGTILDLVGKMPGVTAPYLYFGMYGASFAWHTEDLDLYSINYIHFGASKTWYFIPQSEKERFELLCKKLYASHFDDCKEFLRHKLAMLAPEVLVRNGIRYGRVVHNSNEYVVVFPGVYHAGFNQGFNCAESVNFGSRSWLKWGKKAKKCLCRPDTVSIDCNMLETILDQEDQRARENTVASAEKQCTSGSLPVVSDTTGAVAVNLAASGSGDKENDTTQDRPLGQDVKDSGNVCLKVEQSDDLAPAPVEPTNTTIEVTRGVQAAESQSQMHVGSQQRQVSATVDMVPTVSHVSGVTLMCCNSQPESFTESHLSDSSLKENPPKRQKPNEEASHKAPSTVVT